MTPFPSSSAGSSRADGSLGLVHRAGPRWERRFARQFRQRGLDRHFPHRPGTDQQFVRRVLECGHGRSAQSGWIVQSPDQAMGVDQVPHSMYSLKSSSGASKSGAMYSTVPFIVPNSRGFR